MSKLTLWVIVAIIIVVAVYFIARNYGQVSANIIKVGVIGPFTGDGAVYGEPYRNAVLMAANEINKAGGVNSKSLDLIIEDSKCDGKDAANAVQKLINIDKVQVIIGGFCSSESLAAVPIGAQNQVLIFSPGSSSPALTGINQYFVRDYPSDATQGNVLAQVAFNRKGWQKVIFIQEQTDYALGIYNAFSNAFEQLGGKILDKEEFPSDTNDFRSIIAKVRSRGADALFIDTQAAPATARILKQIRDIGWKPHIIINDGTAGDAPTISANQDLLNGAITAEFGADKTNPKYVQFIQGYKQLYGNEPNYGVYAATSYDAIYLLKNAIEQVGYDAAKISQWLRTVNNWDGSSGKITIQQNGDRASGHQPEIVQNGVVVPYSQ